MIRARRGSAKVNGPCTNCGSPKGGEVIVLRIGGFEVRLCDSCFDVMDCETRPLRRKLRKAIRPVAG